MKKIEATLETKKIKKDIVNKVDHDHQTVHNWTVNCLGKVTHNHCFKKENGWDSPQPNCWTVRQSSWHRSSLSKILAPYFYCCLGRARVLCWPLVFSHSRWSFWLLRCINVYSCVHKYRINPYYACCPSIHENKWSFVYYMFGRDCKY